MSPGISIDDVDDTATATDDMAPFRSLEDHERPAIELSKRRSHGATNNARQCRVYVLLERSLKASILTSDMASDDVVEDIPPRSVAIAAYTSNPW